MYNNANEKRNIGAETYSHRQTDRLVMHVFRKYSMSKMPDYIATSDTVMRSAAVL